MALTLARSTEDSLLDFMSWNSNSNRILNFEYSEQFAQFIYITLPFLVGIANRFNVVAYFIKDVSAMNNSKQIG